MTVFIDYYKGICFIKLVGYFNYDIAIEELTNVCYMSVVVLNVKELTYYCNSDLIKLKKFLSKSDVYLVSDYNYLIEELITFKDERHILKKHKYI